MPLHAHESGHKSRDRCSRSTCPGTSTASCTPFIDPDLVWDFRVPREYYSFVRLFDGYRLVHDESRGTAQWLASQIASMPPFELVSAADGTPAFAFRVNDQAPYSVYDVSETLRGRGWIVPAYPMPPGLDDMHVLRIVVRDGFTRDLAAILLADLAHVITHLDGRGSTGEHKVRAGFHH